MKKIIVVLLGLLLALTCVGCNKDEPSPKPNDPTPTPNQKTEKEEFIERLSANYQYATGKDPGSRFLKVDKDGSMLIAIYCAGGADAGMIGDVALVEPNKYQVRVDVAAVAGNEFQDATEAYSVTYTIIVVDEKTIIVDFPEGKKILYADNGLSLEQLTSTLDIYGFYRDQMNCFDVTSEGMYTRWIDCSEYSETGKISNLVYEGFDRYSFTVDFPKREGNDEMDGSEAYTMQVAITIFNDFNNISIDETVNGETNWFSTVREEKVYGEGNN